MLKTTINLAKNVYILAAIEAEEDYKIIRVHFCNAYVDLKYFYGEDFAGDAHVESNFPRRVANAVNDLLKAAGFPYGVCSKEECLF